MYLKNDSKNWVRLIDMEFFWIGNPTFFLNIGWNYVSIINTIISNITVLVSCNIVIWFGYVMSISHGVNKEFSPVPPTISLSLPGFHQVCLWFYKKYFINLLLIWSDDLRKIMRFQSEINFFFQVIAPGGRIWFCCFVYLCFLGFQRN